MHGQWSNALLNVLLDNETSLGDWTVNYLRVRKWEERGPVTSRALIGDTTSFETLGDIRRALVD